MQQSVKKAHPWKTAPQADSGHIVGHVPTDGRLVNGHLSRVLPIPHLKGLDSACTLVTPHCAPDMQECFCATALHTWLHTWRNDPAAPRHTTVDVSPAPETMLTIALVPSTDVLALCLPLSQASRRTSTSARSDFSQIVSLRPVAALAAAASCHFRHSLHQPPLLYRRIVQPIRPSPQDGART